MGRIVKVAGRIWRLYLWFVAAGALLEGCIYLAGSMQAGHFLSDPEFQQASRQVGRSMNHGWHRAIGR